MSREHDLAVNRLMSRKRTFAERIVEVHKQVSEFRMKDRMSEAEAYLKQLEDLSTMLEEFTTEVRESLV